MYAWRNGEWEAVHFFFMFQLNAADAIEMIPHALHEGDSHDLRKSVQEISRRRF